MIIVTYTAKRGAKKGIKQYVRQTRSEKGWGVTKFIAQADRWETKEVAETALNISLTDGTGPNSQLSYEDAPEGEGFHTFQDTVEIAPSGDHIPVVEVTIGPANEVWVNVDGICKLRAKRCTVTLEDNRIDTHQDEIDDAANNHGQKGTPEWVSIPYELAKDLEANATMSPEDGEALAHYITEAETKEGK